MVFRVHGVRADKSKGYVDVRCDSEAVARYTATRHGLVTTTSVEIIGEDEAGEVVTPPVGSKLLKAWYHERRDDVLVIASGIFLGLTAFTIFMMIVAGLFGGSVRFG